MKPILEKVDFPLFRDLRILRKINYKLEEMLPPKERIDLMIYRDVMERRIIESYRN